MKTKYSIMAAAVAMACGLASCDSYLDKQPSASSNAPITDASQLIALFDYVSNVQENSYVDAYATDDYGVPTDMFDSRPTSFGINYMCFYALATDVMETSSFNNSWSGEYNKIFTANTIISNAASVAGTDAEKNLALANGYFMRAWSMFRLAWIYCRPYSEANKTTLGLPLRLGTLFTEDVHRSTLEETFTQILADLDEAEKYCTEDGVPENMAWRTSKCAIDGLRARIYLYMNDYTKAMTSVDKALALAPDFFDFNELQWGTPVSYPESGNMPAQTVEYCETNSWNLQKIYKWKEWIFIRMQYLGTQWFCPSQGLVDCFDDQENDLRYVFFMVEHGNRRFSVPYDWFKYEQFYDSRYNISGLTTAELVLMKAELQARAGQGDAALATLMPLRQARFATGTAIALTASDASEALKQVLLERRRELPFSARMMDIKRFSVSDTPDDDVTISREFYNCTLSGVDTSTKVQISVKGNDPAYAIPVPFEDVQNSQGMVEQNPK